MNRNHNHYEDPEERRAAKFLDADPRAQLLKMPPRRRMGSSQVHKKTQPKPVLATKTLEQEAIDLKKAD